MTPTIIRGLRGLPVPPDQFQSWVNDELLVILRQFRQAHNYLARQKATFTTAATGVFTTIWSSADIAVGTAVRIDSNILGVTATDQAAFTITALFFNNGTLQQDGATAAGFTQNGAGYAVQFLIVNNHVEVQAKDAGTDTVNWTAVIDAQVGP